MRFILALLALGALSTPGKAAVEIETERQFGLGSFQYGSPSAEYSSRPSPQFSWDLEATAHSGDWESRGRLVGQVSFHPSSLLVLDVPELYGGSLLGGKNESVAVSAAFGRKLHHWSTLDETWDLGLWQSRARWNHLDPEQIGLFGLHVEVGAEPFSFLLYATPLFLPELSAPFETQDGILVSPDPYFSRLPTNLRILGGVNTPLQYDFTVPAVSKILLHPGAGFSARLGREHGTWGQLAYAFKPQNKFLYGFDGIFNISTNALDVNLFPRVAYHHISTVELGYRNQDGQFLISAIADHPVRDETDPTWTTQEQTPAYSVGTLARFQILGEEKSGTCLEVGYLQVFGGNAEDEGRYKAENGSVFEARYRYREAYTFGVHTNLLGALHDRMRAHLRVIRDLPTQGTILTTRLQYQPQENWLVSGDLELLDAPSVSAFRAGEPDFIRRYRANDRVKLGVTYVF